MKTEKIIIIGPSGSGKDHLRRGLMDMGLRYSPKYTTRPKRSKEIDGVEYFFIDNFKFEKMLNEGEIKTYQSFEINENIWNYAISNKNFENNQIFIMTPNELEMLNEEDRKECFIVYLDIDKNIRRNRILKRNENADSVERRMLADEKDFNIKIDYDLKICNEDFDVDMVYDLMN